MVLQLKMNENAVAEEIVNRMMFRPTYVKNETLIFNINRFFEFYSPV